MKNIFLFLLLFTPYSAFATYIGVHPLSSESKISIGSGTYTKILPVTKGTKRIFFNVSSSTVYECKQSSSNVTSTGFPIYQNQGRDESTYFGTIYFQTTSGTADVSYKIIYRR